MVAAGKLLKAQEPPCVPPARLRNYLDVLRDNDNTKMMEKHAKYLGLPVQSIVQMCATYDTGLAALAFPMYNEDRQTTGVRYRRRDSTKFSFKGGREGVFISVWFVPSRLTIVTEGPTDAAAVIATGLINVVGKPSCTGGDRIIGRLLKDNPDTPVIMVADPDEPGKAGGLNLANSLPNFCAVICPPKDIRDVVTRAELTNAVGNDILDVASGREKDGWQLYYVNKPHKKFLLDRTIQELKQ
ncbi:hypothetical protein LCGC14_2963960 [marine sediment metagenome]|uniref:Toprim domain-containing protein n=1 Tax=marine sediment metagenome TaxID=412755 RepID=A0A0F8XYV1_9ZZZZ